MLNEGFSVISPKFAPLVLSRWGGKRGGGLWMGFPMRWGGWEWFDGWGGCGMYGKRGVHRVGREDGWWKGGGI